MTASDRAFRDTLVRDDHGRIIYTYRGNIERGARYEWKPGYSATIHPEHAGKIGGVLYPWMTKRECQRDAKRFDSKAVFEESNTRFAA